MKKNILITGISGTGKSALSEELQKQGYKAFDLEMVEGLFDMYKKETGEKITYRFDNNNLEEMKKYDWICDIDNLKELIKDNKGQTVFYSATASNINDLLPLFDKTFLLTANDEVIRHRLSTRTSNNYGKSKEIQDWTLSWKNWWETDVKEQGATVIDANRKLKDVAKDIITKTKIDK